MNKETYEALKRVVEAYREIVDYNEGSLTELDIRRVEGWINEVTKEYEENE